MKPAFENQTSKRYTKLEYQRARPSIGYWVYPMSPRLRRRQTAWRN